MVGISHFILYRLVSEGTIEENLANRGVQSKILNALAQQGGDAANAFLSKVMTHISFIVS